MRFKTYNEIGDAFITRLYYLGNRELSSRKLRRNTLYYEGESRGSISQVTQSATNLMVVEKLGDALGRLATVLRQLLVSEDIYTENALYHAQRKAVRFDDKDFVDLYDFLKLLRDKYAGDSNELTQVIDEVMDLVIVEVEPQLILANVTSGLRFERVKGLSIYSPVRGYSQFYERSACVWLARLENISSSNILDIFNHINRLRIYPEASNFAQEILEINKHRLLTLREILL